MQEKQEEKISNGPEILRQIKEIKSEYQVQEIDEVEQEMSFLDKLNRLVQLILNDSSFSIYTALDKENLENWKRSKLKRAFKNLLYNSPKKILYFLFLSSITIFLVSEAVIFYADGGEVTTSTYAKALLTEISFIFLSGYVSKNLLEKVWVNFLRAGVFSLMLFVISSQTIIGGAEVDSNAKSIQDQIVFLEQQIEEKEKTIEFYQEKGWGVNVRKHTDDKNELVNKLIQLKDLQASGSNTEVSTLVRYKSYGQAFFRVILLFISVLITRRLFTF